MGHPVLSANCVWGYHLCAELVERVEFKSHISVCCKLHPCCASMFLPLRVRELE